MKQPLIINIQRYSIHDGDGIRTTIFFKGCPLNCGWCHNPESQRFARELMFNVEKCTGCGACAKSCPNGAIFICDKGFAVTDREKCRLCEECIDCCLGNAREIAGKEYTVDELVTEAEKDSIFYEQSGGGVTLSGGEVMAQPIEFIEKIASRLYEKGCSVNIDTCGFAPYENFERILPFTDVFLYDIKEMDSERHKELTGAGNTLILENLKKLSNAGARIYLRIPLIGNANCTDKFIRSVIDFLKTGVHVEQVNLLPYHNIGKGKYERLNRDYDAGMAFKVPTDEQLKYFAELFCENGFSRVIIGG